MGLPFMPDAASNPGFRPAFAIKAAAPAGGGGLLDAVSSAASSLIGLGASQSDPWAENLQSLSLTRACAPFVDQCSVRLSRGPSAPEVALGDALTASAGFDSDLKSVLTGTVTSMTSGTGSSMDIIISSPAQKLASMRQNSSYEQHSLSDLLQLWANEAGVSVGTVEAGPTFPFVAIDDRRSIWDWMAEIAGLCGLKVWLDGDGALQCKAASSASAARYVYGQDVIAFDFVARGAGLEQVSVSGEGAAGSQGAQAWSWLVKNVGGVQVEKGGGSHGRVRSPGLLRNRAAVESAAQGLHGSAKASASSLRLRVSGAAHLGPESRFDLSGCPQASGDGSYKLGRVTHRYDAEQGFTSELHGVKAA